MHKQADKQTRYWLICQCPLFTYCNTGYRYSLGVHIIFFSEDEDDDFIASLVYQNKIIVTGAEGFLYESPSLWIILWYSYST